MSTLSARAGLGVLLLVVASNLAGQSARPRTVHGWRTGGSAGLANMGGDFTAGPGVALMAAFNFVPKRGPLGIGFAYNPSFHGVNGDVLVLHQLTLSPRVTRVGGSGTSYQYISLDAVAAIWDFNFSNQAFITSHAQASGVGLGPSAGLGALTFSNFGIEASAAYTFIWFGDSADPNVTMAIGGSRAKVLRVTIGLWYKGEW